MLSFASSAPPAAGAAIGQVIAATLGVAAILGILAVMALRHRAGRPTALGRAADASARLTGLPGWSALPSIIATVSLLMALFGMYWDISLHIDEGRDEGPLANLAHYPILFGLIGIFAAGWLAISLPRGERPGPAAVRLAGDWYAPVGGILIFVCGGFALAGFPLDDVWHRIFGQDVTLWGPTHLLMLGGAAMTLVGQAVLLVEGMRARDARPQRGAEPALIVKLRRVGLAGGLLLGLSIFQAEFDFGVPQFRLLFQPLLIALSAGFALTAARIWVGRGGALAAVAMFLVIRAGMSLAVGPVLEETTPALPLYLAEALCVEAAALVLGTRRPLALGAVAGLLAGTVGLAAEWGWAELVMPLDWTSDLLPEAAIYAPLAGIAGGLLGGLLAAGLRGELPSRAAARTAFAGSLVVIGALVGTALAVTAPRGATAELRVVDRSEEGGTTGVVEARFTPPDLAADAAWATVTAWQGGGLEVVDLEPVGNGLWRSAAPVPLHGDWKANVRIQNGRDLVAAPVYLPEDPAIPAPEVPVPGEGAAPEQVRRDVIADKEVLQREAKDDVAGGLWPLAAGTVLALYLAFVACLAWGVGRLGRRIGGPSEPAGGTATRRAPRPVGGRAIGART